MCLITMRVKGEAPREKRQTKKEYGGHALEPLRRPVRKEEKALKMNKRLNRNQVIKDIEGHSRDLPFYCGYN